MERVDLNALSHVRSQLERIEVNALHRYCIDPVKRRRSLTVDQGRAPEARNQTRSCPGKSGHRNPQFHVKLIFVNRFYWPETPATGQLLTDLAEGLVALGWEVIVITSAANGAAPRRETQRGVSIIRIRGTRWARLGTLGKAIDFATFYLGALGQVLRRARADSIVIPMTDPPMLGVGILLAARIRGARVVHWIQDIYPEIAIELFGHAWLRILRPLRNAAWRAAHRCVTLGTDMAVAMFRAGVNPAEVTIVPNWAPAGVNPTPPNSWLTHDRDVAGVADPGSNDTKTVAPDPRSATSATTPALGERKDTAISVAAQAEPRVNALRRAWGLDDKFVVAYSGNLGRVHDLEPILTLAEFLQADTGIALLLVGDGAQRLALETAATNRGLRNVSFRPPQPRDRLQESLAAGDLHLVTLRPGCEHFVFPSKLYGAAAAGRPVLFLGPRDCEVARCVKENGLGLVGSRDELARLASAIRELDRDPSAYAGYVTACRLFSQRHDPAAAIGRWHDLLSSVVRRRGKTSTSTRDLAA